MADQKVREMEPVETQTVEIIPPDIENLIYMVRNKQVMVDSDLAMLYQVETGALNRAVIIAVHLGEVADISGVAVKDSLYRYGVALMCLYNRVIGEKSVTHRTAPPFPLSAASRQAGYAARLCCVSSRFVLRFLSASSAGSNTKRFPPASVPAAPQEQPQGSSYLKISSAPGQRTDRFRHSPALENTRLWCLVEQTFLRSDIQGRFPVSTSPPAYGQH